MRKKILAAGICIVIVLILVFVIQTQKNNTVAENIKTTEAAERIENEFGISLEANEHGGFAWRYVDAYNEDRTNNVYSISLSSDENGMLDTFGLIMGYGRLRDNEDFCKTAEDAMFRIIPAIFTNEDNIEFVENFIRKNLPDYDDDNISDIHEEAIAGNYKVELWITKSGDYYKHFALNLFING